MDTKKVGAIAVVAVLLALCGTYLTYGQEPTYEELAWKLALQLHENDLILDEESRSYDAPVTAYDILPALEPEEFPSSLDLRDFNGRNVVSPIADQKNFGVCWAFSVIKAAEISYATAIGYDYNEDGRLNISERHLIWFAGTAVEDGPQAGEGKHFFIPDADNNEATALAFQGGESVIVGYVYMAGIGPAPEYMAPYEPVPDSKRYDLRQLYTVDLDEDGTPIESTMHNIVNWKVLNDERYAVIVSEQLAQGYPHIVDGLLDTLYEEGLLEYAGLTVLCDITYEDEGDYTLDEDMRYINMFYPVQVNWLPDPALKDSDGGYVYSPVATQCIKSELNQGRGVAISLTGDNGDPGDSTYLNYLDEFGNPTLDPDAAIYAHYTYDLDYDPQAERSVNKMIYPNHAVCIIGYDDDFPKEYFTDPNGTIGGDGAWLAANSWGLDWGNGFDGTFWISYYDQSLTDACSMEFEIPYGWKLESNVYDYTISYTRPVWQDTEISMANVFTAIEDCTLWSIGAETDCPDTRLSYRIYLLDDGWSGPEDGELLEEGTASFTYKGIHTIELQNEVHLEMGDVYSVVITNESGNGYALNKRTDYNKAGKEYYCEYHGTDPYKESMGFYIESVVNPGESFVCYKGQWLDWTDVIMNMHLLNADLNNDGFDYDNFPIRSYLIPDEQAFG